MDIHRYILKSGSLIVLKMPFCCSCGNFTIVDFSKLCDQCHIRYLRNELYEGEIRQTSLKMERSLRLPLLYFLHAFDITPISVSQNLLFSITRPFEPQTERQYLPNITEESLARNTVQESTNIPIPHQQYAPLRHNPLQTHRLATLGLVLAILGIALLATDIYLITLVIESTALIVAIISNRLEIRSWRQRLTIGFVIIYWIVVIFMLIVMFNELFLKGLISI